MRLDAYLAEYFPEHSRSTWQKYIEAGKVLVNGKVETDKNLLLDEDDQVTAETFESETKDELKLPIIYEDDNVIVINKPVGILSHAKGGILPEQTVADFFKARTTFGIESNRPGIVHRLDRATSGVMIGAKNHETASFLQKQFSSRKVKKQYVAIVSGNLTPKKAKLDLPIERNPKKPSSFRVGPKGKTAQTLYEVLKETDKFSELLLSPQTGRTHQLRVHMAYIKHPIVGDTVYEGEKADRLYLHAKSLEITIPGGERKMFSAPVPIEFEKYMAGSSK